MYKVTPSTLYTQTIATPINNKLFLSPCTPSSNPTAPNQFKKSGSKKSWKISFRIKDKDTFLFQTHHHCNRLNKMLTMVKPFIIHQLSSRHSQTTIMISTMVTKLTSELLKQPSNWVNPIPTIPRLLNNKDNPQIKTSGDHIPNHPHHELYYLNF